MLIVPMDSTRTLVALGPANPRIKDQKTGEMDLDRVTGEQLLEVQLVMQMDEGAPLAMLVSVPQSGIVDEIQMGSMVKATGLRCITDVSAKGKHWAMYSANALTVKKG